MGVSRRAALLGILGLVASFTSLEVEARRGRRVRISGRGLARGARHSGPVLSRDQLRQCVSEQNQINSRSEHVDRAQASLDAERSRLNHLEQRIERAEPLVDVYSQESVDSFNAMIDQHRRLVASFNERLPASNSQVETLNAAVERFNSRCGERAYYEHDMAAVLAGK